MDDQKLREMFRQGASQARDRTPSCPDAGVIASYVDAEIQPGARETLELHLADCERCTWVVGALSRSGLDATNGVSSEILERARRLVTVDRPNRWTQYLPHLAAAAVVVLAITVVIDTRQDQPVRTDSDFRTTRGAAARSDVKIVSPTSGASVSADDLVIRWTEIPEARSYVVRIVTDSGALVTEQRVSGTEWRPKRDLNLEPGKEYYVRVEPYPSAEPSDGSIHVPFTVHGTR